MSEQALTPDASRALGRERRDQERAIQRSLLQDGGVLEEILGLMLDASREEVDPELVFTNFAETPECRTDVLDRFRAGDLADAVLDGIVFPRFLNAYERLRTRAEADTEATACLALVEPLLAERERIIGDLSKGNAGLVRTMAASLEDVRCGTSIAALEVAGMRGLSKASGRFEPERGYKFTTYAAWWVAKYVGHELGMSHDEVMHRWSGGQLP